MIHWTKSTWSCHSIVGICLLGNCVQLCSLIFYRCECAHFFHWMFAGHLEKPSHQSCMKNWIACIELGLYDPHMQNCWNSTWMVELINYSTKGQDYHARQLDKYAVIFHILIKFFCVCNNTKLNKQIELNWIKTTLDV